MPRHSHSPTARCHWGCGAEVADSTWRTPFPGVQPLGSVGLYVCSPGCPNRPTVGGQPAPMFERTSNVPANANAYRPHRRTVYV